MCSPLKIRFPYALNSAHKKGSALMTALPFVLRRLPHSKAGL